MSLPSNYAWLAAIANPPRMIAEALKLYGTHEIAGSMHNPVIMGWAQEIGISHAVYSSDEIPWCGLFMGVVAHRAQKPLLAPPADMLWALNWGRWGSDGGQPELGDVLTFIRNGGGHVGLYVGEDATAYHVLGGNTGDAVSIARIEKTRLRACRQYFATAKPASVKPYHLSSAGPLSTNEA